MSQHLDGLIERNFGATSMQVVFLDIEKYSRRKSTAQRHIIDLFTTQVQQALNSLGQSHIEEIQRRNLNLSRDVIRLPTGDGMAIVFTFDGAEAMALDFCVAYMKENHENNTRASCERFAKDHWCNCHNNFRVRSGVAVGKGIVYKDINKQYNVAGNAINVAARVMGLADGGQVLFDAEAYRSVIDMTTSTDLEERFTNLGALEVKHGVKVNVYQLTPPDCVFINSELPGPAALQQQMQRLRDAMPVGFDHAMGALDEERSVAERAQQAGKIIGLVEQMQELMEPMGFSIKKAADSPRGKLPKN